MIRNTAIALLASCLISSCVNDEMKVKALFEKKLGVEEAINIESYMSQG